MGERVNPIDDTFLATLRACIKDFFRFVHAPSGHDVSWTQEVYSLYGHEGISPRFLNMFPFIQRLVDGIAYIRRGSSENIDSLVWNQEWAKVISWESEDHMLEECFRVFARLTEKPEGALVSLWDLLDEREIRRFVIVREVFYWTAKKAKFPIPYDPETAMFTKASGAFAAIEDLLHTFKDWEATLNKKA